MEGVAIAHAVEHPTGECILLLGPFPDLFALAVFEPAIRIGNRAAEQIFYDIVAARRHG